MDGKAIPNKWNYKQAKCHCSNTWQSQPKGLREVILSKVTIYQEDITILSFCAPSRPVHLIQKPKLLNVKSEIRTAQWRGSGACTQGAGLEYRTPVPTTKPGRARIPKATWPDRVTVLGTDFRKTTYLNKQE